MIPIVLGLGLIAGFLLYHRAWWFVPLAAIAWVLASQSGTYTSTFGGSATVLGALNAAVGVSVAVALRWVITRALRTPH